MSEDSAKWQRWAETWKAERDEAVRERNTERERLIAALREPPMTVLAELSAQHSARSTNNPNEKVGGQLPQAPWPDQPGGWRERCERETAAVLSDCADWLEREFADKAT